MAEAITDRQVVAVLRPFVRSTRLLLDVLREADPFGVRERAPTGGSGGSGASRRCWQRYRA